MSVSVLTNFLTNPNVAAASTNWVHVAGTGGTASGARNTGLGYTGVAGFFRVSWTVATTAVSGGFQYTQASGLSANTFYHNAFWVRSSVAQTVALTVTYKDSGGATVNTVTGPATSLTANAWTLVSAPGSSGAAVTQATYAVAATTGGVLWANGNTLDGDLGLSTAPAVLRTNEMHNPVPASTAGYTSTYSGGSGTWSFETSETDPFARHTKETFGTVAFRFNTAATTVTTGTPIVARAWMRASAEYTGQWRNDSTAISGATFVLPANVWTEVTLTGYVTPGTTFRLGMLFSNINSGATIDVKFVMWNQSATLADWFYGGTPDQGSVGHEWSGAANASTSVQYVVPQPFDGASVNAGSTIYAWTGTANASTSTATLYTPVVALVPKTTYDPCPRVEVTVTDLTPTDNTVTVWRTADGKRTAVQGARLRSMVGSDFVIDYSAPLARTLTYDVEVTAGISTGIAAVPASTNVAATTGCVQDPLVPSTAMPIYGDVGPNGELAMIDSSAKALEYAVESSVIGIMGSPDPVGILGQRMSAKGIAFNMVTEAAQAATDMRNLVLSSPLLLVRPLPDWVQALPGACYIGPDTITEKPINAAWGGNIVEWHATTPLLAAPSMNIVIPLWTYGDVDALWTTYQQAQTELGGGTYLDALKSPSGA